MSNLSNYDYSTIENPYNNELERSDVVSGAASDSSPSGGAALRSPSDISPDALGEQSLGDLWIGNFIKSETYRPKKFGFYLNAKEGYIECMKLYVGSGGIIGGSLDIPDTTTANSFHVEADGDTFWGCNNADFTTDNNNANAYILKTGVAKFQSVTLSGSVKINDIVAGSEIAIQGWQFDGAFSASDYRVVAWASGTLTLLNGDTYAITGANTGNMAALTYIYLDIGVSTTLLQTSTTASSAVGSGKILIAVAQNNSDISSQATFQVFGGKGGQLIAVDNIAANSASVNEFVANTANVKDAIITNAKITTLDVGKLTAGTITSKAITLAIAAGTGDTYINSGKTDFTNTDSGFILGMDDSDSDLAKFYIGDSSYYFNWTGTGIVVNGATISSPTLTSLQTGSDIAIQGWSSTLVFTATDYRTVSWSAGGDEVIKLADSGGTTYTIANGNTGSMAATTYIYLDVGTSTTVIQKSVTYSDAVGANKILLAVAKNNADISSSASIQAFGGKGGQLLTVDEIAANSASINEFVSNTAQIKDAIITNAKVVTLGVDKLIAGTISSKEIVLGVTAAAGDAFIAGGSYNASAWTATGGFILGLDDSDSDKEKFFIGDATTSLDWNVTTLDTLTIKGTITATSGAIGGWTISSSAIYLDTGVDATSSGMASGDYPFYAGKQYADRATAPFRVSNAGALTATSATITGAINAISGKFGTATNYWSVSATGLTAVSGSTDVIINYGKTDFGQDSTNGFILGYDYSASKPKFEIGSSATKILKYDGTDLSLIGGTITGGTVQTATSGARVVMTGNDISFYDDTSLIGGVITGDSAGIDFLRTDDVTKGFVIRKRVGMDYDADNVLEFYANPPAASRFNAWFNGRRGNDSTSNLGYYGIAINHDTSKASVPLNGQFLVDYYVDGVIAGTPPLYITHSSLFLGAGNTGVVSLVVGSGTNGVAGMGYEAPLTMGDSTSQFDITDQGGGIFRYTWDGTGLNPFTAYGAYFKVGMQLVINAQNFNANNNGTFKVYALSVASTYWEITNGSGVAETNKTIGTGSIGFSLISYNLYTDGTYSIKQGGNLLPETDVTWELGSSAKRYNYIYTRYIGDSGQGIDYLYFTSPSRTRSLYAASTYDIVAEENFKVAGYLYIGSTNHYLQNSGGTLYWAGGALSTTTGTVTSVATSGAITGGTITTTGTISHSTSAGYKHIPTSGSTYQTLYNSGSGTGSWTSNLYAGASSSYYWSVSGGRMTSSVDVTASGSVHATGNVYTGGISSNTGSLNGSVVSGSTGSLSLGLAGRLQFSTHVDPANGGSYNLGGSTRYWGDVSYKTLTDRGCLGWFDEGVELQDGRKVSDVEAIQEMKKHTTKKTIYGVPMLDYKTFPKVSYKKATKHDGTILPRDSKTDEPYDTEFDKKTKKEKRIPAQDGIEMTSVFSIMLGAIKELDNRIKELEKIK